MKRNGFTMVEMAIALVIVGFLAVSFVQGQELIRQSNIRSVTTSLNSYSIGVNAFRTKYGGIPGDFAHALDYGLNVSKEGVANTAMTCDMSRGFLTNDGDGDGLLSSCENRTHMVMDYYQGEVANFWVHLSNAQLIKGTYSVADQCGKPSSCSAVAGVNYPKSPLGNGIIALSDYNNRKLYYIVGVKSVVGVFGRGGVAHALTLAGATDAGLPADGFINNGLTPEEAYSIDAKLDDGKPTTGNVMVVGSYAIAGMGTPGVFGLATAPGPATCYSVSGDYNVTLDAQLCTIRVRAST